MAFFSSSSLQGIYDSVADMRVVPAAPPEKAPSVPEAETEWITPPLPGPCSSFAMFIHYEDTSGAHSWRRIVCRRIETGTSHMLHAYCLERKAFRMFRADRILEAVELETGEVLDCPSLVDDLRARGLPVSDSRLGKVLTSLTFLMRCDGQSHPLEHEAIDAAVSSFVLRFECDDSAYDEGIKLARSLAPDGLDFTRSLRWLTRSAEAPKAARFLIQHACAVVDADGRLTPEEAQFGSEVGAFLKKVAAR